jgi:hypothetical protein
MPNLKDEKEFYEAIGRAITEWAHVEAQLFEIFHASVGGKRHVSLSAYYAALSLQVKLQMTTDALTARLNHEPTNPGFQIIEHPLVKKWDKLDSKIDKASKKRNQLAHYHAVINSEKGRVVYTLRQNPRNPKFFTSWLNEDKSYTTPKIESLRKSFWELRGEIFKFRVELSAALEQRVESPE